MSGIKYSAVHGKPLRWHVDNIFPEGLTLVVGGPGCGKGTLLARVTGDTTRGDGPLLVDKSPGSVVTVGIEDDPETCTVHRLNASNANLDLVTDITWDGLHADEHPVHDSTDGKCECKRFMIGGAHDTLDRLESEIREINADPLRPNVKFVTLDPLNALAGCALRVDNIVRHHIMEPLQAIGKRHHVAIALVHHFNKDGKVGGSQGIVDAARHVLNVERANARRSIRIYKTNIANDQTFNDAGGLNYYIVGDTPANTARFDKIEAVWKHKEETEAITRAKEKAGSININDILGGKS